MPRKTLIRTSAGAYHVTSRVNHRLNFPIPLSECWEIFMELLRKVTDKLSAEIHAFVLMSNHYHMLLTAPLLNIDVIMKYLNREATRTISAKTGLINHIFGARYRWSLTYGSADTSHVLKYIYRNPVKAGLVKRVEEYSYSTVLSIRSKEAFSFLCPPTRLLPKFCSEDPEKILRWLNEPLKKEQEALLRKAIRRKEFKFNNDSRYQGVISNIPAPPW